MAPDDSRSRRRSRGAPFAVHRRHTPGKRTPAPPRKPGRHPPARDSTGTPNDKQGRERGLPSPRRAPAAGVPEVVEPAESVGVPPPAVSGRASPPAPGPPPDASSGGAPGPDGSPRTTPRRSPPAGAFSGSVLGGLGGASALFWAARSEIASNLSPIAGHGRPIGELYSLTSTLRLPGTTSPMAMARKPASRMRVTASSARSWGTNQIIPAPMLKTRYIS